MVGQSTRLMLSYAKVESLAYDLEKTRSDFYQNEFIAFYRECDVFFICLPTPYKNGGYDLSSLESIRQEIRKAEHIIGRNKPIVVRSTVLPGTTEELFGKTLSTVLYMPEFLTEKNWPSDALIPSRIVVGSDHQVPTWMFTIVSQFKCPHFFMSLAEAETAKLLSNAFLATRISWFNEMRKNLRKVDSEKVFQAIAADPRIGKYGSEALGPFGGHCLPKDTQALNTYFKGKGKLLKATIEVNEAMK